MNPLAMVLLYKQNSKSPQIQNYQIAEYALGSYIPANTFGGSFSGKNITDESGYIMTMGNLSITAVTTSNIQGELDMSGYYVRLFEQDTTRIVNISGYFDAIKMPNYSMYSYPEQSGHLLSFYPLLCSPNLSILPFTPGQIDLVL